MTLLARSVIGFLIESAAWVTIVAGAGATVSAPLWWPERTRGAFARATLWSSAGAVAAASLAHRLDGPYALLVRIGRRDLAVLWLIAGAALGTGALALHDRRTRTPA